MYRLVYRHVRIHVHRPVCKQVYRDVCVGIDMWINDAVHIIVD